MLFFIAGITGNVGGAAARQLLAQGHTIRTLARDTTKAQDWANKGVDVRAGAWDDAAALTDALSGVDGAHIMVPPMMAPSPGFPEQRAIIDAFRQAIEAAKPPRVTVLSSIGSEQQGGLGLITATHLLEQALTGVSAPVALIRASSFLENALGGLAGAAATGVYASFNAPLDRALPMIATEDIGQLAAKLLTDGWEGRKIIELGTMTSPDDLAAAMAKVLGREVKAQAIPREQWTGILESFGLPRGGTWAYEEMLDGVNSGHIHFGVAGTEAMRGTMTAAEVFARAR